MLLQVWPGETVYPDYLSNPNTTKWLTKQLRRFYQQAPFDGVWLDMSEASNFCSGMKCVPPKDNKAAMHCELTHCLQATQTAHQAAAAVRKQG